MPDYEPAADGAFLGLAPQHCAFGSSRVLILPVPYEATTSYGAGTRGGPAAIIDASAQVELYDSEFGCEPALTYGIHTLPALVPDASPDTAMTEIADTVARLLPSGKLLGLLGGEHGLSAGVARGVSRVHPEFVTVQLDAHADLRDSYDGTPFSHACAARRIAELSPIMALGIRSLDVTEAEYLQTCNDRVRVHFADKMRRANQYLEELAEFVRGRMVYLTVDVDVFDPSVIPATGTPEPGGLGWYEVLEIVRTVALNGQVVCFDCVELAPAPGMHAADFTIAKLVYNICSYVNAT